MPGDEAAEDNADLQFLEKVSDTVQKAVEERTERRQKQKGGGEKREKEREERPSRRLHGRAREVEVMGRTAGAQRPWCLSPELDGACT